MNKITVVNYRFDIFLDEIQSLVLRYIKHSMISTNKNYKFEICIGEIHFFSFLLFNINNIYTFSLTNKLGGTDSKFEILVDEIIFFYYLISRVR